jgi:uncharacterized protein YbaP (TraB family)
MTTSTWAGAAGLRLAGAVRRVAACGLAAVSLAATAQAPSAAACPPVVSPPSADEIRSAQQAARDRGFLWRISKGGVTSYLYGTIHLGSLQWAPPGPTLLQALEQAQVMALELDVTDAPTLGRLQAALARDPAQPPVSSALGNRLAQETQRACLPAGALADQKPAVQALTLVLLAARWEGLDASYAQEAVLAGFAQSRGMPIVALETVEEQMAALLPGSPKETERFVEQALAQLQSGAARRATRRLAQAWADGKLDDLAAYEQWCECVKTDEDRATLRRLNDDRNPALASRIERLHAQGKPVFAGVGALHMTGPRALPLLLQQRGFQVERVAFPR